MKKLLKAGGTALALAVLGALGIASIPIVLCALMLVVAGFITLVIIAGVLMMIGVL